jgi:hypothetical protein
MAYETKRSYGLYSQCFLFPFAIDANQFSVSCADMMTTTRNGSNDEIPELIVEIGLDGSVIHRTGRLKQQGIVSWNEELRMCVKDVLVD